VVEEAEEDGVVAEAAAEEVAEEDQDQED